MFFCFLKEDNNEQDDDEKKNWRKCNDTLKKQNKNWPMKMKKKNKKKKTVTIISETEMQIIISLMYKHYFFNPQYQNKLKTWEHLSYLMSVKNCPQKLKVRRVKQNSGEEKTKQTKILNTLLMTCTTRYFSWIY